MATGTGGTAANNTLTALRQPGSFIRPDGTVASVVQLDADIATMNQGLKDDQNSNQPAPGGGPMWGWSRNGQLYVPNRGWLRVLPGDVILFDTPTGWPILLSQRAAAGAAWVTTA
jgi:hypothetical protein